MIIFYGIYDVKSDPYFIWDVYVVRRVAYSPDIWAPTECVWIIPGTEIDE